MDCDKMTRAVFIDLKNAYVTVDQTMLAPLFGIDNKEIAIFESYLFDRRQLVQYDGTKSDMQLIYCGIPQGSILGLLFVQSNDQ